MAVVTEIPELMHRTLFRMLSLLSPDAHGAILRRYFDWWHRQADPWKLGTDTYERHKYETTLAQIPDRPYRRILEVGCAEGVFTQVLATRYPQAEITGLDISARALTRARHRTHQARVRFTHADILEHRPEGRYDLVFCAETLYYLGRDDRIRRASAQLSDVLAPDGLLVMVHPWPESQRLHGHLNADPGIDLIGETIETSVHRPFSVALYRPGGPV